MIYTSEGLKNALLDGHTKKNIRIQFENSDASRISFVNVQDEFIYMGLTRETNRWQGGASISLVNDENAIHDYWDIFPEICVSGHIKYSNISFLNGSTPSYVDVAVGYAKYSDTYQWYRNEEIPYSDFVRGITFTKRFSHATEPDVREVWGFGMCRFLDANHNVIFDTITADVEITKVQYVIGKSQNEMPYDFDRLTPVQLLGYNPADYITIIPVEEEIADIDNDSLVNESFSLTESICSNDVLKFGSCESATCEFDVVGLLQNPNRRYFKAFLSVENINEEIPLGRFRVAEVEKRNANGILRKHITAYDGISPLSVDATNYFSSRMGGVTLRYHMQNNVGIEYSRQMLETLNGILGYLGASLPYTQTSVRGLGEGAMVVWEGDQYPFSEDGEENVYLTYTEYDMPVDSTKYYKVDAPSRETIKDWFRDVGYSSEQFGVCHENGGILIIEENANGVRFNKFCVDSGNYFALHSECRLIHIRLIRAFFLPHGTSRTMEFDTPYLTEATLDTKFYSPNFPVRLCYYNYLTRKVEVPTCTARDIIRSLVEITGAFFKFDRYGKIAMIYPSSAGVTSENVLTPQTDVYDLRSGLFPRNDLYPGSNLYPVNGALLTKNDYISVDCEDYMVSDFGSIQIQLMTTSENVSSTKIYQGDESKKNVYLMDDNVFYCNNGVNYDDYSYDGIHWTNPLPEVTEMMANMYEQINNVKYVPHTTEAPGLPWLECGDRLLLLTNSNAVETFIFRRSLKGIQALRDEFSASGEEQTDAINDYGIYDWQL